MRIERANCCETVGGGEAQCCEFAKGVFELRREQRRCAQEVVEEKGAVRKVKKIGNAQLFEASIEQNQYRSGLVRDLLDLFGGSPRLLVSNLLESGSITLKDLKALQNAAAATKSGRVRASK